MSPADRGAATHGRLNGHPLLAGFTGPELDRLSASCVPMSCRAGTRVLRQGERGDGLYFLVSGQLGVFVERRGERQPVAHIHPPGTVGELSFVTGRDCMADVEVLVDAELLHLPDTAASVGSPLRARLLGALTPLLAERLRATTLSGAVAPEAPAVLLIPGKHWEAPNAFATSLAGSLAAQHGFQTLLVQCEAGQESPPGHALGAPVVSESSLVHRQVWRAGSEPSRWRQDLARRMPEWRARFDAVVLDVAALPSNVAALEALGEFTNCHGFLLGPGDPLPAAILDRAGARHFVVQSAARPTLPGLDASHQLIAQAAESELAWQRGQPLGEAFLRTVGSLARCVAGTQIGLALGGGAAWGWAHAGVLAALESAAVPVDAVAGCSMGSVMGALLAAGYSPAAMCDLASEWRSRTRSFLEWRFWRLALLNERAVRAVFTSYFGERRLEQLNLPFRANTVDLQTGREVVFSSGSLVDCLRASVALPGLLPPVEHGAALLVDAAIANPVPAGVVRSMGCHFGIGVNAMAELSAQPVRRRYPRNAFEVLTRCMFLMGHEIGDARAEPAANVVFTPPLNDIAMMQFERAEEIVERGRQAALAHLPAIHSAYSAWKASRAARAAAGGAL